MKLDEIEKLCSEAVPGPWQYYNYGLEEEDDEQFYNWSIHNETPKAIITICRNNDATNHGSGKFIAASRNLMPKLVAVIKALKSIEVYKGCYEDDEGILEKALAELEKE